MGKCCLSLFYVNTVYGQERIFRSWGKFISLLVKILMSALKSWIPASAFSRHPCLSHKFAVLSLQTVHPYCEINTRNEKATEESILQFSDDRQFKLLCRKVCKKYFRSVSKTVRPCSFLVRQLVCTWMDSLEPSWITTDKCKFRHIITFL